MRNAPALHARDHLPGGADPIEGAGFHGFAFQMSSDAADAQNTYWGGFSMDIPQLWFDTVIQDTDGYFGGTNDEIDGSLAVVPAGLGGWYQITARIVFTHDDPAVDGAYCNLDVSSSTQFIQFDLPAGLLSSQVDEKFVHLSGLFLINDEEHVSARANLTVLTSPLLVGNGYYTSLIGFLVPGSSVP